MRNKDKQNSARAINFKYTLFPIIYLVYFLGNLKARRFVNDKSLKLTV